MHEPGGKFRAEERERAASSSQLCSSSALTASLYSRCKSVKLVQRFLCQGMPRSLACSHLRLLDPHCRATISSSISAAQPLPILPAPTSCSSTLIPAKRSARRPQVYWSIACFFRGGRPLPGSGIEWLSRTDCSSLRRYSFDHGFAYAGRYDLIFVLCYRYCLV